MPTAVRRSRSRSSPVAANTSAANSAASSTGDSFVGAVPLKLPIAAQAGRESPLLLVKLLRTGDVLQGSLVAYASPARLEFLLPFAVRLAPAR